MISSSMVFENATEYPTPETAARLFPCRRRVPTVSRSSPASTSPRAPGSSTSCPTPSSGPSTAWASGERRALTGQGSPERQHQARDEPRGAGPRAEDPEGSGPAAHPRQRRSGPLLHVWRRSGEGHREGGVPPRREERGLQPLDPQCPATSVPELAEQIWTQGPRRGAKPFRHVSDKPYRVRRAAADPSTPRRPSACSATRQPRRSLSQTLDEVIPWIKEEIKHGRI